MKKSGPNSPKGELGNCNCGTDISATFTALMLTTEGEISLAIPLKEVGAAAGPAGEAK